MKKRKHICSCPGYPTSTYNVTNNVTAKAKYIQSHAIPKQDQWKITVQ